MIRGVTLQQIERILAVTDRRGIHREKVEIPLAPRKPGRVRVMPNGKLEIVVEDGADFDTWLAALDEAITAAGA